MDSRYDPPIMDGGRLRPAHDVIWEKAHGQPIPEGYVIHHIDGNGHNNDPANLQCMPAAEHIGLHTKLRHEGKDVVDGTDPAVIADRKRRKEWHKKYYPTHKEKYAMHDKKYREKNRDKIIAREHKFYEEHHDEVREAQRKYEEEHKEERAARNAKYDAEHHEERLDYFKEYRLKNLERIKARDAARRIRDADKIKARRLAYRETHRAYLAAKQRVYMAKKRGEPQEVIDKLTADMNHELELIKQKGS